jgi:hypothetical protein
MSLQRIINKAETISFNRRRPIGLQFSKSQIPYAVETVTRNPWQMTVKIAAPLVYDSDDTRSILETLDKLDRANFESIYFSNNLNLSFMIKYRGELFGYQLNAIRVTSFVGNQLTLSLPADIPTNTIAFKAGDFLQIANHPHPFTVVGGANAATVGNVVLTSGQVAARSVTITVHRGNFLTGTLTNLALNFGSDCRFQMFCQNMPTYTIIKMGKEAYIQFDSEFQMYEWTGTEII